jgi:hypothetical protein
MTRIWPIGHGTKCATLGFALALTLSLVSASAATSISLSPSVAASFQKVRVFQAWSPVEGLAKLSHLEAIAKHGLVFNDTWSLLELTWVPSPGREYSGLMTTLDPSRLERARSIRAALKKLNPDMRLIVSLGYREGSFVPREREVDEWWRNGEYPPDSPLWLRDSAGNLVVAWGEDSNQNGRIDAGDSPLSYLLDFRKPELRETVALRAQALKESGLFDGVFLDWMSETSTSDDMSKPGWEPILSAGEELAARVALIKEIRARTGADFIIMGNTNDGERPVLAPLLNAVFMECAKSEYGKGYTDEELARVQSSIAFNQNYLAAPALVCLEGWRRCDAYLPDLATRLRERSSAENQKTMRLFTAMSLCLTDGYALFSDDNALPLSDHLHSWYRFWDAPIGKALGKPVTLKGEPYKAGSGFYLREYENAFVAYNMSGSPRELSFSGDAVKDWQSGSVARSFSLPDRDGAIYLKRW